MRITAVLTSIFLFAVISTAQIKAPVVPPVKIPFQSSQQVVVVTTADWDSTRGTAELFERKGSKGKWKRFGEPFSVAVGRSGLAWGDLLNGDIDMKKLKQEGDGNAPAGIFPLTTVFGTASRPAQLEMPYTRLGKFTECVDDARSNFYNRIVDRMRVGNFDWKSSEKMLEVGDEYSLGVFVAYNSFPVEKGRGSCIFLHVWKAPDEATSGCTAMDRRDVERIAGWLSSSKNPYLVQMPRDVYDKRQKSWKLPKLK